MAEIQIKDVFDTVRVPLIGEHDALASQQFTEYGAGSSHAFGQASIPVNMIPTITNGEVEYNKRTGFRNLGGSSLKPAVPAGYDVSGKKVSVLATFQPTSTRSAVVNLAYPEIGDCVFALMSWNTAAGAYRINIITGTGSLLATITPPSYTTITDIKVSLSDGKIGTDIYLFINVYNIVNMGGTTANTSQAYFIKYNTTTFASWDASTFTQITDVDYPGNNAGMGVVGPLIQFGQYVFAITRHGYIYASDLASVTTWSATSYSAAFSNADSGMCLAKYKNHLIAFGERNISFFNDVGLSSSGSGTSLQMVDSLTIRFGTPSPLAVQVLNDTIYWIASDYSGIVGLYKLNQYTAEKVSSGQADQVIRTAGANPFAFRLSYIMMNNTGNLFIGGTYTPYAPQMLVNATYTSDPNSLAGSMFVGGTLAYNIDSNMWWKFSHSQSVAATWFPLPFYTNTLGGYPVQFITFDSGFTNTDNEIDYWVHALCSEFDVVSYYDQLEEGGVGGSATTDNNYPICCGLQGSLQWFGTEKRKRIHKLKLIGNYNNSSASSGSWLWFVWHKADANTATNSGSYPIYSRAVSKGTTAYTRLYIPNMGMSRTWTFAIAERSVQPFNAKALEADISLCMS